MEWRPRALGRLRKLPRGADKEAEMARYPTARLFDRVGVRDGMNRRELDRIFEQIGGSIERPRGTGEVLYRHPLMARCARANARRKDASRHLVHFVKEVLQKLAALGALEISSRGASLRPGGGLLILRHPHRADTGPTAGHLVRQVRGVRAAAVLPPCA